MRAKFGYLDYGSAEAIVSNARHHGTADFKPAAPPTESDWAKLFALGAWLARGIRLEQIDATIEAARGIIAPDQVEDVVEARLLSIALLKAGNFAASMEAAQALWNSANAINSAIEDRRALILGREVTSARDAANRVRKRDGDVRKADWQKRANEKWSMKQHADKSARAIAKLIALPGENVNTIRRSIKKLA